MTPAGKPSRGFRLSASQHATNGERGRDLFVFILPDKNEKELAMPAPAATQQPSAVDTFVARTTMRSILDLDQSHLDQIMATAYLLYQAGRYREVDVLCKGLIAADHTYWWSYSLHAAALRRLGRLAEALQQVDNGLLHEPAEPKLLLMRGEILAAIGAWRERPDAATESAGSNGAQPHPASIKATATSNAAAGA
jgi:hypothetical protein